MLAETDLVTDIEQANNSADGSVDAQAELHDLHT